MLLEEQKVLIRGKHIAISKFSPSSMHDSSRILGDEKHPLVQGFLCSSPYIVTQELDI
jgi:hypothetical protein